MTASERPLGEEGPDEKTEAGQAEDSVPAPGDSPESESTDAPLLQNFDMDYGAPTGSVQTAWHEAPGWHRNGWPPVPLPWKGKTPPPKGLTGHNGEDLDLAAILAYTSPANVGLRCPEGVIGLDVDEHGTINKKTGEIISGGATLDTLERHHGALPPTWQTRGRREGRAGIRWFRVPRSTILAGQAGPAIDVIQRHHRYACVWPSMHKTGVEYQTVSPSGDVIAGPMPPPEELPELPAAWLTALTVTREAGRRGRPRKPFEGTQQEWRNTRVDPDGDACPKVTEALERARNRVEQGEGRHDTALKLSWELAHLGVEGHHGVGAALDTAEAWFATVTADEGRDPYEWFRMVDGATYSAGLRGKTQCHCQDPPMPDGALEIGNPALAMEWLRDEVGTNHLAGVFLRARKLVYTPRIGEKGYIPPKDPRDDDGPAQIRQMFAGELAARVDYWYTPYVDRGEDGPSPTLFYSTSAQRVLDAPDLAPNVRSLFGVTHTPMMRADGSVLAQPGYDDESGYLFLPGAGEEFPPVPGEPSEADLLAAVVLLLKMVQGFPFVSDSDRANYLGALLTPCLRLLLPPPYPLIGIGAPMQGSGKSYLAMLLRIIHGGVFRSEWPRDETEVKKSILALLRDTTAPVVQHDNVTGTLRSPTLAGLLTSGTYSDRLLGVNENPSYPNDRLWVITGNSLAYGGDIPRRTVEITIDPNMPRPWERKDFAIKDLECWAQARRGELLRALLVLARAWVVEGMPVGERSRSDSFGRYVQGIRGVLAVAGVRGTFDDLETKSEPEGSDDQEWAEFLVALRKHFGTRSFTVKEIVAALSDLRSSNQLTPECLPAELAEKWAKTYGSTVGFARTLGLWMRNRAGRFAGGLNVRRLAISGPSDVAHWKVEGDLGDLGE